MPTDQELDELEKMPVASFADCLKVVERIRILWHHDYGLMVFHSGWLRLATGGWSDNEAIIGHLPSLFHAFCWESSHRGGLHVYHVPKPKPKKEEKHEDPLPG